MKRTLAFALSLMMVLSMLPAAVLAEEAPVTDTPVIETPVEDAPSEAMEPLTDEPIVNGGTGAATSVPVPEPGTGEPTRGDSPVIDETAPLVYSGITGDGQVRFYYSAPASFTDTDKSLYAELELYFCKEANGQYRLVDDTTATKSDWISKDPFWAPSGVIFAEHGEGYYYVAARCKYSGEPDDAYGVWGYSEPLYFTYAEDAVQLEAPLCVIVEEENDCLVWEAPGGSNYDYVVLAVIWQGDEENMDIVDFRRVTSNQVPVADNLLRNMDDGLYNISLIACSDNYCANYLPSAWSTYYSYKLGSNPDTDPDVLPDNPDAVARLTRMQAVHLLVNTLELEYDEEKMTASFFDVTDPIDAQAVAIAVYCGFANGTSAGTFSPDAYVTRAQLAMILNRALDLPAGGILPSDVDGTEWYINDVKAVMAADLMFTDAYGNFRPNDIATADDVDPDRIRELAKADEPSEAPQATGMAWDQGINLDGTYTAPGYFSFYGTNGVSYELNLYRRGENGDTLVLNKTVTPKVGFWNILPFHYEPSRCQTGVYYFTVQALGDNSTYGDAPVQISEDWSYTRPAAVLSATDLYWDVDMSMNWTVDEDLTLECELEILYNSAEDDLDSAWVIDAWNGMHSGCSLSAELLASYGTGWYYFSVIPATSDPSVALTPETPVYSGSYYHDGASNTIVLPAASDLQWHTQRWDDGSSQNRVGAVSFHGPVPEGMDYVNYYVEFYRKGEVEDVLLGGIHTWISQDGTYANAYPFDTYEDQFTTGTYYFTVTALGDYVTTFPGPTVQSGDWYYERPDALPMVTGLSWNADMSVNWTGGTEADYYEFQFQHVADDGQFDEDFWHSSLEYLPESDAAIYPSDWMLHEYGTGKYYFRVRAISEDITEAISSDWSDWSPAFDYTKPTVTLTPTDLRWDPDTGEMLFDLETGDESMVDYYIIRFHYSETNTMPDYPVAGYRYYPQNRPFYIPKAVARDYGEGYYWFVVRAISNDPTKALSGWDDSDPSGSYYFEGINNPAPAPINLAWNTYRNSSGTSSRYELGTISFGRQSTGTNEDFQVDFYRKDASGDKKVGELWTNMSGSRRYRNLYPFESLDDVFTTGTYYFIVTPMGDGVNTSEGQPVRSDDWYYVRPDTRLEVSSPKWGKDMSINWTDAAQNDDLVDYYEVQYQFVADGAMFYEDDWDYWTSYHPNSDDIPYPPTELLTNYGNGRYFFRMRAMSADITQAVSSDWSAWSSAFGYVRPSTTLTVSSLQYSDNTISWTPSFGADAPLYGYRIYIYDSKQDADNNLNNWWTYEDVPADETSFTVPSGIIENLYNNTAYFMIVTVTDNPVQANSNYDAAPGIQWTYAGPSTPAAAPLNLQWNTWRSNDGFDSEYDLGTISFGRQNTDIWEEYRVDFYRKEASGDKKVGELWTTLSGSRRYRNLYPFEDLDDVFTTGTYYFTVTPMGDGITIGEGQPVRSDDWHYVRPNVKLGLSNAHWGKDMSINWTDAAQNDDYLGYYEVRYQYVGAGDRFETDRWNYGTSFRPNSINDFPYPPEDLMGDHGNGKYYFQVRAISRDITSAVHSDWSDWSEAFTYTRPATTLTVSDLKWDGNTLSWTPDFGKDAPLAGYNIYIYESIQDAVGDPYAWWDYDFAPADATSYTMPQWMLENLPNRTWYFAVTTISANPAAYNSNYGAAPTAAWTFAAPTTPAAAATDLRWNVRRWNDGSNTNIGSISFVGSVPQNANESRYQVDFYRKDANGSTHVGTTHLNFWHGDTYVNYTPFDHFADRLTSGTYYFTVTALGDGVNTCDGPTVTSPDWTYVRPNVTLGVSNPVWNSNMSIGWTDAPQNGNLLWNFDLEFLYVAPGQAFDPDHGHTYGRSYRPGSGDDPYPPAEMLLEYGSGTYYFRMRAMPEDVTKAVPSGWTDWSTGFTYTRPSTTLTVSGLKWDGNTLSWKPNFDPATAPLLKYWIYVYENAGDAVSDPWNNWNRYLVEDASATSFTLPNWEIENLQGRDWYFAVVTVTSNPNKATSNWGSAPSCKWTYTAPANKLPAPTDLKWHIDYNWQWNQTTQQNDLVPFTRKGSVSFKRPVDANGGFADQAQYDIEIFRIEADGTHTHVTSSGRGLGSMSTDTHVADGNFIYRDLPSGKYYFKVRCRADGGNYASSDWVSSLDYPNGIYEYKQPAAQLSVPTGLYWDDRTFTDQDGSLEINALWTPDSHSDTFYFVEYFFAKTADTPMSDWVRCSGSMNVRAWGGIPRARLHEESISEYGEGIYYFRVQALPDNIEDSRISEWSPFSPGYRLDLTVDKVNDALDNVNTSSAAAIQNAVSNIDHLDKAMAADAEKGTSGTLDKLKDLEDKVKADLGITTAVNSATTAIDSSKVSVSNMALNVDTAAAQGATVTLNITTPSDPNVAPPAELIAPQKKNTVVFSMDIDGAKDADDDADGKQLLIPVQITLPIPGDINPAFLVILHQKSDGSWEELRLPHVFREKGQWYATFNVHSFSNYAMGEKNITAQAEGTTVTVDAHLPTSGANTQYLCAVYSAGHQMLGLGILQPQAENALTITLGQPVPTGAYLKIFAPDAGNGWAVHSDAIKVEIQ